MDKNLISPPLRVALQMDPLETINPRMDSTFALALEAQRRNFELFHYLPEELSWDGEKLEAFTRPVHFKDRLQSPCFSCGPSRRCSLEMFDVILVRQDPPFNMEYLSNLHLLERLGSKPLVMNPPSSIRDAPEKIFVLGFPDLIPPTIITRDSAMIRKFWKLHGNVVVKPLFGHSGRGVFRLAPGDQNLDVLLETFGSLLGNRQPLIVQRYLPEVTRGDKRIVLVDGEPVGAINRLPPSGALRTNLHLGGRAVSTTLSARDLDICKALRPHLRERKILFAGIDVIGDWLTEINITSPSGLRELDSLEKSNPAGDVWDAIRAHLHRDCM